MPMGKQSIRITMSAVLLVVAVLTAGSVVGAEDAPPGAVPFDPFDESDKDPFAEGGETLQTVADPIIGFNRTMFVFNDRLYFWVLKPVASGYRVVVPPPVRVGIKNFFFNLLTPVRLINCLLQGKGGHAGGELGRFFINSTVGMAGFLDPAKEYQTSTGRPVMIIRDGSIIPELFA